MRALSYRRFALAIAASLSLLFNGQSPARGQSPAPIASAAITNDAKGRHIVYQTARIGVRPSVHGGEGYQPEGEINGVPTQAGAFKFTVTANDAKGCIGSRDYKLKIGDVKAKG